ncbi:MAG: nuclease [Proteobacteria bacterium]|nr:nuclease [Pseudomonadota bacterium]
MNRTPLLIGLLFLAVCVRSPPPPDTDDPGLGTILLAGTPTRVLWSDGDSFKFLDGARAGRGSRLQGYNTLETYGPVHRWGDWTSEELHAFAKESAGVAASRAWECTTKGLPDKYGRLLVECPDLRRHMIRTGTGHVYPFDEEPDPELVELQLQARLDEIGMWEKGRPEVILTSVKPFTEARGGQDWFVNGRTGESGRRGHQSEYQVCEEVCIEPLRGKGSCLVYVPFAQRYGVGRADCLR